MGESLMASFWLTVTSRINNFLLSSSCVCYVHEWLQKSYENRLVIRLSQSSERVVIQCRGEGLEPRIEFDRPLLEFGPILPHSPADERDVTIRNPCQFPVEIYNLEFDKVYVEEEKVSLLGNG